MSGPWLVNLVLCTTCIIFLTSHPAAALRQFPGENPAYITRHHDEELNLRPLIGIVSQGGEPAPDASSYIAASYIKFVEAAGARAVPILHDMSVKEASLYADYY